MIQYQYILTPFGRKDELYVKDIQEDRIIIAGDHLTNVKCFYQVWADRLSDEPLVVNMMESQQQTIQEITLIILLLDIHYDVRE